MITFPWMLTAHREFRTTGNVHHSVQWLAFPTHQTRRVPTRSGFHLSLAQNIMKNKKQPIRSHHIRVAPKNIGFRLDRQLRQRTTVHEVLSHAVPRVDQIIEMRQKTQQIRLQLRGHVAYRGGVISELSESVDGVEYREARRTFDLHTAQLPRKAPESLINVVLHLTQ
jgi:hypothetical protein